MMTGRLMMGQVRCDDVDRLLHPLQAGNADDESDGEYSDDGAEETQLESYNTPLDDERCPVDEYIAFKEILSSE